MSSSPLGSIFEQPERALPSAQRPGSSASHFQPGGPLSQYPAARREHRCGDGRASHILHADVADHEPGPSRSCPVVTEAALRRASLGLHWQLPSLCLPSAGEQRVLVGWVGLEELAPQLLVCLLPLPSRVVLRSHRGLGFRHCASGCAPQSYPAVLTLVYYRGEPPSLHPTRPCARRAATVRLIRYPAGPRRGERRQFGWTLQAPSSSPLATLATQSPHSFR